jgi:hypothetical protein
MTGHFSSCRRSKAIICVLSVQEHIVPPTINHEADDNDEEIDYNSITFNEARSARCVPPSATRSVWRPQRMRHLQHVQLRRWPQDHPT